jgi:hypothetical protein
MRADAARSRFLALIALGIFVIYTIISFDIYTARTLNGDVDKHILAGDMFGVPSALEEKGLTPLYYGQGQTGWDGQFYYYMSNDIFATDDTVEHIDNPPYRYQRIGLSLYASIAATLLGQDWVSPRLYLAAYFFLIAFATYFGGRLLQSAGANPLIILLWSLSIGTQITLFNALPDAAADAFLIIATYFLSREKLPLSAVLFTFSALSREVYVLFPLAILVIFAYKHLRYDSENSFMNKLLCLPKGVASVSYLLIPVMVTFSWQLYVYIRFGTLGGADAPGILGLPFQAWLTYFSTAITGTHLLLGQGWAAYAEAISLILFAIILVAFILYFIINFKKADDRSAIYSAVGCASFCLALLYASFGPTVIMHYTGYFKAISVFFFVFPLLLYGAQSNRIIRFSVIVVLAISVLVTTAYNMKVRILPSNDHDRFTQQSRVLDNNPVECFGNYEAQVKIKSVTIENTGVIFRRPLMIYEVELLNTSPNVFVSTRSRGGVNLSYHWVDGDGRVVQDGIRTAILRRLLPGESLTTSVVSELPQTKDAKLIISPVQEGCAWFYLANPNFMSQN